MLQGVALCLPARGRPPQATARRAGLEFVEKLLTANLTSTSPADGVQTFRLVTYPTLRSALLAGGLLAFAVSFDEIIVTTFTAGAGVQTLPIWIFTNLTRPNQAPVVNVVAVLLVLVSVVPIWLAQRLSEGTVREAGAGAVAAR